MQLDNKSGLARPAGQLPYFAQGIRTITSSIAMYGKAGRPATQIYFQLCLTQPIVLILISLLTTLRSLVEDSFHFAQNFAHALKI